MVRCLKYLVLILCIWIVNNVFAQFQSTVFTNTVIDIDVSVNLFKNGKYIIILNSICDGNIYEYGLSAGNYLYHKDTVILNDAYYNYSLKFLRNKNELLPIKTFPWMNKKLVTYNGELGDEDNNISHNIINYYKPLVYKDNNQRYKVYYGEYKDADYSLVLKKENYYACKLDGFIISEGKFVYNGKYITFYDKHLNFSFIGTLGNNIICVGFYPFKNDCLILKR